MKISIDTKEDSHEDIKKVISMLQHLVGESAVTNNPNIFEDNEPPKEEGNVFGNLFGESNTETSSNTETPASPTSEEPSEEKKIEIKDDVQMQEYF
ncbi:hypothetical protein ACFLZX_02680 [Nanoarchaeota archaeon]